jgi:hypothetical protein
MRYLILSVLIVLLSLSASAQSGGVKGRVVADENERSLSGVEIVAMQDAKEVKSVKSDSKGGFSFQGLADGIYSLSFDKDGYRHSTIRFEVKKGKINDMTGRRLAMLRDPGSLVLIQGTIFDQSGFSVPGARVEISRMTGGNVWEKIKAIYSSESGEFIFRFEPTSQEINYRVTVTYKGIDPIAKEKTADSAGIYRLSFNLPINVGGPKQTDMTKDKSNE